MFENLTEEDILCFSGLVQRGLVETPLFSCWWR
jgi:hypothetical protein